MQPINWFDLTPLPLLVFPVTLLSTFLYKIQAHYLLHRQPPLQSRRCDRFRLLPRRLKTIDVPVLLSCRFPVWTKHKSTLEPKLEILIPIHLHLRRSVSWWEHLCRSISHSLWLDLVVNGQSFNKETIARKVIYLFFLF